MGGSISRPFCFTESGNFQMVASEQVMATANTELKALPRWKRYQLRHPERCRQIQARWRKKHREYLLKRDLKNYYEKIKSFTPEELESFRLAKAAYDRKYREANRERRARQKHEYYLKNYKRILAKEARQTREARVARGLNPTRKLTAAQKRQRKLEMRVYWRKWSANKRKTDLHYKIKMLCHRRIGLAINGTVRSGTVLELLGCSIPALIRHLESQFTPGMSWANHSLHGWHIDHIKPCHSFNLTDPKQQRECFHYTNLQPLWAKENISKKHHPKNN